jgi:hypothetical protein
LDLDILAEQERFELSQAIHLCWFSKPVPSATWVLLQGFLIIPCKMMAENTFFKCRTNAEAMAIRPLGKDGFWLFRL